MTKHPPRSPYSRFRALANLHKNLLQVAWTIRADTPTQISFWSFRNDSGIKGQGRIAMASVCRFADRLGVQIRLNTQIPKLYPYYEAFGFKHTNTEPTNPDLRWYIREPVAS